VVVDEVDDLAVGFVFEVPVGHVGLPALVGERCFETLPARARTFLGLRGDEASPNQDPVDRRPSRRFQALGLEVVADGGGARVEAELSQTLP
jgi:hypothetical protein